MAALSPGGGVGLGHYNPRFGLERHPEFYPHGGTLDPSAPNDDAEGHPPSTCSDPSAPLLDTPPSSPRNYRHVLSPDSHLHNLPPPPLSSTHEPVYAPIPNEQPLPVPKCSNLEAILYLKNLHAIYNENSHEPILSKSFPIWKIKSALAVIEKFPDSFLGLKPIAEKHIKILEERKKIGQGREILIFMIALSALVFCWNQFFFELDNWSTIGKVIFCFSALSFIVLELANLYHPKPKMLDDDLVKINNLYKKFFPNEVNEYVDA